jgi:hypothetical protein
LNSSETSSENSDVMGDGAPEVRGTVCGQAEDSDGHVTLLSSGTGDHRASRV